MTALSPQVEHRRMQNGPISAIHTRAFGNFFRMCVIMPNSWHFAILSPAAISKAIYRFRAPGAAIPLNRFCDSPAAREIGAAKIFTHFVPVFVLDTKSKLLYSSINTCNSCPEKTSQVKHTFCFEKGDSSEDQQPNAIDCHWRCHSDRDLVWRIVDSQGPAGCGLNHRTGFGCSRSGGSQCHGYRARCRPRYRLDHQDQQRRRLRFSADSSGERGIEGGSARLLH